MTKKPTKPQKAFAQQVEKPIDGEVRLIDRATEDDLDDIRASRDAAQQPGERVSIDALRRKLGI